MAKIKFQTKVIIKQQRFRTPLPIFCNIPQITNIYNVYHTYLYMYCTQTLQLFGVRKRLGWAIEDIHGEGLVTRIYIH